MLLMNTNEAKARHDQLMEEIRRHDYAYYVLAQPAISDLEYDQLYQELLDLEKEHPELVTPDSPSQRVGGQPVDGFARVKHLLPMLSLEKIKASKHPDEEEEPHAERRKRMQDENTLKELEGFDATLQKQLGKRLIEYVVEPKVDGVSIGIHYENGKLSLGVTRGDGTMGDDITSNIKTLKGIPLELRLKNPPKHLEVRGEAYISRSDFEKLNAKMDSAGERAFPNARNATAGTLKQLDPRIVAQRPIRAVFYGVGACEGAKFATHSEVLESLKSFGLPTQSQWWICKGMEEVFKCYNQQIVCGYDEARDLRSKVPYEIDGIVIKVNDLGDWDRIPPKAKAPGYAIVHKPIPWITPAETVLKGITVQVGRTGVLTPVAELEPIFIQGSTISRATLHNEDEIRRKDVRIGDTVRVRKAGMVIPEVYEVVKELRPPDAREFDLVKQVHGKCPACGGPIVRDPKFVAWRCQNIASCPAQSVRRLEFMAQRSALDIEGLGGVVAEKLIESGLVKEPLDMFKLTVAQMARLNLGTREEPRVFGEKNATKVLEALRRSKTLGLARWVHALGIPNVGERIAFELSRLHRDLQDLGNSKLLEAIVGEKEQPALLHEELQRRLADNPRLRTEAERLRNKLSSELALKRDELENVAQEMTHPQAELASLQKRLRQSKKSDPDDAELMSITSLVRLCQKKLEPLKKRRDSLKGRIKTIQEALPTAGLSAEIGVVVAKSTISFFDSPTGSKLLKRLEELKIAPQEELGQPSSASQETGAGLVGKTFVLTGTLSSMSRDEAGQEIRKRGGNVTNSVSKHTSFLVVGEEPGATKSEQAKELGVPQITENQFLVMLDLRTEPKSPKQQGLLGL
jgi:DNA ligase (NAD+)